MNKNAIKAATASIILNFNVTILNSKSQEETARLVYWIARKEQEKGKRNVEIRGRKKPKSTKKLQEFIISSFPGISSVLSKRILEKFETIENFTKATEQDLTKIDGIGKALAKKIKNILTKEYGKK